MWVLRSMRGWQVMWLHCRLRQSEVHVQLAGFFLFLFQQLRGMHIINDVLSKRGGTSLILDPRVIFVIDPPTNPLGMCNIREN